MIVGFIIHLEDILINIILIIIIMNNNLRTILFLGIDIQMRSVFTYL